MKENKIKDWCRRNLFKPVFVIMILGVLGCCFGAVLDCMLLARTSFIVGFISWVILINLV